MLIYSAIASLTYIVVIFIIFYVLRHSKKPIVKPKKLNDTTKQTKLNDTTNQTNEQQASNETVTESTPLQTEVSEPK